MVTAFENETLPAYFTTKVPLTFTTLAPLCELRISVASSISAIDGSRVSAMSGELMLLRLEGLMSEVGYKKKSRVSTEGMCLHSQQIGRS